MPVNITFYPFPNIIKILSLQTDMPLGGAWSWIEGNGGKERKDDGREGEIKRCRETVKRELGINSSETREKWEYKLIRVFHMQVPSLQDQATPLPSSLQALLIIHYYFQNK